VRFRKEKEGLCRARQAACVKEKHQQGLTKEPSEPSLSNQKAEDRAANEALTDRQPCAWVNDASSRSSPMPQAWLPGLSPGLVCA